MTRDTISRFNRDTVWLAAGVLGIMVFAAVVLAIQERHPKATQADRQFLLNPDSAPLGSTVANSSNADGKMTPGPGSIVDHAFSETPVQEIPSSQMEPAASTPTAVLAFTPEMNPNGHLQESARVRGPKTRNARNSADVKRRLVELWHQSLARSEKSRSWTALSNLNRGVNKKAAYTAEINH